MTVTSSHSHLPCHLLSCDAYQYSIVIMFYSPSRYNSTQPTSHHNVTLWHHRIHDSIFYFHLSSSHYRSCLCCLISRHNICQNFVQFGCFGIKLSESGFENVTFNGILRSSFHHCLYSYHIVISSTVLIHTVLGYKQILL